jgi:Raf kinase inhibitor-like YbhB/YbcL family protein
MKLSSDSFRDGGSIPAKCAFAEVDIDLGFQHAGNRNPHLAWHEVAAGTESLVLLCIDGDAPTDASLVNRADLTLPEHLPRGDFFHWSLVDIPLGMNSIAEGALSKGVTARGKPGPAVTLDGVPLRQGINDYQGWFSGDPAMAGDYYGYDGPCPPWNDERVHHYIFRLYALDVPRLELEGRFTCADVLNAIHGHIIDEAQLIGSYTLNPPPGSRSQDKIA